MTDKDPFVIRLDQWIEVLMHRSIRNFIHYTRESGLSMSQLGALFHLNRLGSSGVSDLGNHLGVSSAAASQMLERLLQQGLILRSEDPSDRRVKQIILTDRGYQVLKEAVSARQGWLKDLAKTISDNDKVSITSALDILIDKANQLDQPDDPEK